MTHPIDLADRVLIERVRMVNKALSIFVFALQEGRVSADERLDTAAMLTAVADTIREQTSPQADSGTSLDGALARRQIEALQGSGDT